MSERGNKGTFGVMEMPSILTGEAVTRVYITAPTLPTVPLNRVHLLACKLYLNKIDFKS